MHRIVQVYVSGGIQRISKFEMLTLTCDELLATTSEAV